MTLSMKSRLSVMMFLQYSVPGATLPVFSYYLMKWLGLSGNEAGVIMAMPGVAMWITPVLAAHVTGRWLSAERLLTVCALFTGVAMFALFWLSSFWAVLTAYFLYGLALAPVIGLTNTVALHHLKNPARDFGGVRMWGTFGWCVVAWSFGYFYLQYMGGQMPHALLVSAGVALVLAAYSLSFRPASAGDAASSGAPLSEVLRIFLRPSMAVLTVAVFFNSICHQYYYFGMAPYLHQMGFADGHILPAMSLGQTTEVILLGLLGRCLLWLGMKRALIAGVLFQALRMVIFAVAGPWWLILLGLSLHGFCYALFFTTAYLYLDRHSTPATRPGAQQLLTILIAGCGPVLGFIIAGYTARLFTLEDGHIAFWPFWMTPVAASLAVAALLAAGFRDDPAGEPGGTAA